MYTHVHVWKKHLMRRLGRALNENDYLFPYISSNGTPDTLRSMSYKMSLNKISDFTQEAGLTRHYSTHCFRRGGSQYRFIHAPIGERWALNMIRWWGGWAGGEKIDTLMHYLVNSLQVDENSFCDALDPLRLDRTSSFMGEHQLMKQPVTGVELKAVADMLMDAIKSTQAGTSAAQAQAQSPPEHAMIPSRQGISSQEAPSTACTGTSNSSEESGLHNLNRPPDDPMVGPAAPTVTIPGLNIPSLPAGGWKKAVEQWHFGDPTTGLKPLKDWKPEEYKGCMRRQVGTKRRTRELIATEFERQVPSP